MTLKGCDKRRLIVIINMSDLDACRQGALAVGASHSCDCMFASFEKLLDEVLADITGSLAMVMSLQRSAGLYDLHQQWPPSQYD